MVALYQGAHWFIEHNDVIFGAVILKFLVNVGQRLINITEKHNAEIQKGLESTTLTPGEREGIPLLLWDEKELFLPELRALVDQLKQEILDL